MAYSVNYTIIVTEIIAIMFQKIVKTLTLPAYEKKSGCSH